MGFGLWSRISCTVGKALPTGESGPKPEAWSPKPPPLSSSAKELPDVLDEQLRLFHRREMSASGHLGVLRQIVAGLDPAARRRGEGLSGEPGACKWHLDTSLETRVTAVLVVQPDR